MTRLELRHIRRIFARLLVDMVETDKYGYYHANNEGGYISWVDLAEEAYRAAGMNVRVDRVTTAEYGLSVAARPYNSRLDGHKLALLGWEPRYDIRTGIERTMKILGEINSPEY